MSKKQVLVESAAPLFSKHQVLPLTEDVSSKGRIRVQGPAQKIGEKNQNNRVYPESVWDINLSENSFFMRRLKNRQALGELEHPESGSTRLHAVSHLIEKAWKQQLTGAEAEKYGVSPGKYIMTQSLILNTPNGNILKELFSVGVPVGTSSRGRGNLQTNNGIDIVQDDYELNTWDYVENPSVGEARHRPLKEQGEPGLAAPPPPEEPGSIKQVDDTELPEGPPKMGVDGDLVAKAEELIRAMEDAVAEGIKDAADLAELFTRALDILDALGASASPDDSKVRGQILTLSHVIARRIGGGKEGGEGEPSPEKKEGEETPEKKEPEGKEGAKPPPPEEPEKKPALESAQPFDQAVGEYERERKANLGTVFRGEIENILNRYGHDVDDTKVEEIAQAMRKRGYDVKEREYGKLPKVGAPAERRLSMSADAQQIIAALAERNQQLKAQLEEFKDAVTKKRYDALSALCEKLVQRVKKAEEALALEEKRYKAAVKLTHGVAERAKKLLVRKAIDEAVRTQPHLEAYNSILEECSTVQEVNDKIKKLSEASKTASRRDLPPLNESAGKDKVKQNLSGNHPLISGIARRC